MTNDGGKLWIVSRSTSADRHAAAQLVASARVCVPLPARHKVRLNQQLIDNPFLTRNGFSAAIRQISTRVLPDESKNSLIAPHNAQTAQHLAGASQ